MTAVGTKECNTTLAMMDRLIQTAPLLQGGQKKSGSSDDRLILTPQQPATFI